MVEPPLLPFVAFAHWNAQLPELAIEMRALHAAPLGNSTHRATLFGEQSLEVGALERIARLA